MTRRTREMWKGSLVGGAIGGGIVAGAWVVKELADLWEVQGWSPFLGMGIVIAVLGAFCAAMIQRDNYS